MAQDPTPPAGRQAAPIDTWGRRSEALAELLARVALGDRQAFAALYRDTSAHLFGVILRIHPHRAQAEDLLQDVFISVWRAAQGFDALRSQPLTWLTSIARNRAIDSLRRAGAQPQTVSTTRDDDDDRPDAVETLADEAPGPLDLLGRASDARQLSHCMEGLSPPQRQSVALAFFDGLSHVEVAEQLREPLGTVKSWVRRALMALKGCLESSARRDAAGGA